MNQDTSISTEDMTSCGCDVPDSEFTNQGIVPNVEPTMTDTTVSMQPTLVTIDGVPVPSIPNITFTFNYGPPTPPVTVPAPQMHEEMPIKIISEKDGHKPGCYFDDDGICAMCGGGPSETIYSADEYAVDKPYGNVKYADPGYRDGKARYPIDTEEHVRAALAYINMPKNAAKYDEEQLEKIKGRIHAAAKRYGIEVSEGEDSETGMGMARSDVALLAGAAPLAPPATWFADPKLSAPTRLTISEDGRVFGHLAQWRTCHVGIGNSCVIAPKSHTNYSLFKIGSLLCDDGTQLSVGKIVMGSAHANAQWGVMPARDFYDNTSMAAAIVNIGEDKYGIWVNGVLTPDMTPEKVVALRASALSGDWRTINGNMELIAALAVNSPGFPIYREAAGRAFSLQAIGVVGLDDVTGEFSMATDEQTVTPPTGIHEDQAARMQRLNDIESDRVDHQRAQRFAQLAALDEERDELEEDRPRTYSSSPAIRGQYNNSRVQMLAEPDADEYDDGGDDEAVAAANTRKVVRRR